MILPLVAILPPERIFNKVDLPDPLDPVIASREPEEMSRSTLEKTFLRLNALLSFCIDSSIHRIVCAETSHNTPLRLIHEIQDKILLRAFRNIVFDD